MAGTWLGLRSALFFGQIFRILARKSVFFYRTPDFVNGPFVALDNIFDLAPSDRFLVAVRRAVFRPPGRIFARKSVFCYRIPDFVNGPFVTLCEAVNLAPLDRFLNFSFPSYGVSPSGLRPKNLHFFTLHPYNPHFLGSDRSDLMGS